MPVIIRLSAALATVTSSATFESDAMSISELVSEIRRRYPRLALRVCDSNGNPHSFVAFYRNAQPIKTTRTTRAVDEPLSDGDEVSIISAVAGG